jgi:hypothetical protein
VLIGGQAHDLRGRIAMKRAELVWHRGLLHA